ncbi:Acyl-CoA synthetase family member 2, mitochondrial [Portunus trituberculatus]|uniref:Acyl-CoA synthetase family member 2, mitochondrial n=1 Tax=Portunus trituberculatus TaxID=210409 RepID=A0A5B7ET31_PORTR|nr:Acyl-CoA synthetase family member 2, mitochondrial [Portunus trituberculatus]
MYHQHMASISATDGTGGGKDNGGGGKDETGRGKRSDRIAAGLLALGLEPGDRLGIWGPNSYEWVLTQFAAAKAGLILRRPDKKKKPIEVLVSTQIE